MFSVFLIFLRRQEHGFPFLLGDLHCFDNQDFPDCLLLRSHLIGIPRDFMTGIFFYRSRRTFSLLVCLASGATGVSRRGGIRLGTCVVILISLSLFFLTTGRGVSQSSCIISEIMFSMHSPGPLTSVPCFSCVLCVVSIVCDNQSELIDPCCLVECW